LQITLQRRERYTGKTEKHRAQESHEAKSRRHITEIKGTKVFARWVRIRRQRTHGVR